MVRSSHFDFSHLFRTSFQVARATDAPYVFLLIVCFDAGPLCTMASATLDKALDRKRERLADAESVLETALFQLRGHPESDEAKQGVAEAKQGVAEAELGVAKAELAAATASASPQRIAEAKQGVAEAKQVVAEAKLGVAEAKWEKAGKPIEGIYKNLLDSAQKAYDRALDAPMPAQGERSPKSHAQNVEPFCAGSAACLCGVRLL